MLTAVLEIGLFVSGVLMLTSHQGSALKVITVVFFVLVVQLFSYLSKVTTKHAE